MKAFTRYIAAVVILGLVSVESVLANSPVIEDQPHMQQALEALKQARHHLEQAIPDKGGHRVAALKAVEDAIKHTEEGINFGNEHHDHDKK